MRSSQSAILALSVTGVLGSACGAGNEAPPVRDARAALEARELETLRERTQAQDAQIRELEGRLALAQAEMRDLRDARGRESGGEPQETVRIGSDAPTPDPNALLWDEEAWQEPETSGPRPVLRLYGRAVASSDSAGALSLPTAPPGVPDRLAVVPLPADEEIAAREETGPTEVGTGPDPVDARYRAALVLVRDRRYAEAAEALDGFVERHAGHPRWSDALYWLGVVQYAQRRYDRALLVFRRVSEGHRDSERAADAMLKMGMCHMRMGDAERARALFQRVRRQFPNSVAARMASQEDAS